MINIGLAAPNRALDRVSSASQAPFAHGPALLLRPCLAGSMAQVASSSCYRQQRLRPFATAEPPSPSLPPYLLLFLYKYKTKANSSNR